MNWAVKHFVDGKRSWCVEEMKADSGIVRRLDETHALGLILAPRYNSKSKSPATLGVPLAAVVVDLTEAGRLEALRK